MEIFITGLQPQTQEQHHRPKLSAGIIVPLPPEMIKRGIRSFWHFRIYMVIKIGVCGSSCVILSGIEPDVTRCLSLLISSCFSSVYKDGPLVCMCLCSPCMCGKPIYTQPSSARKNLPHYQIRRQEAGSIN